MQFHANRTRTQTIFCLIRNVAATVGYLFFFVTLTPVVGWLGKEYAGKWADPSGDVLIVLGGASRDDRVIAENTLLRSDYAARIFKDKGFKTIVVVGGGTGTPLAATMRDYLICRGIPLEAIVMEDKSSSTRENGLFSKSLLETLPGRKVLLTSDYHMYRARRVFANLGIPVETTPIPDVIKKAAHWQDRWPAFLDITLETVKIGYYRSRGWI